MPEIEYEEVSDNSGHHYVIPADRVNDFDSWVQLDEDDPRSDQVPDYAVRINGVLRFTGYRIV